VGYRAGLGPRGDSFCSRLVRRDQRPAGGIRGPAHVSIGVFDPIGSVPGPHGPGERGIRLCRGLVARFSSLGA